MPCRERELINLLRRYVNGDADRIHMQEMLSKIDEEERDLRRLKDPHGDDERTEW